MIVLITVNLCPIFSYLDRASAVTAVNADHRVWSCDKDLAPSALCSMASLHMGETQMA